MDWKQREEHSYDPAFKTVCVRQLLLVLLPVCLLSALAVAGEEQLDIVPTSTKLTSRSPYYDWGESTGVENPARDTLAEERQTDLARRMAIYAAMVDRMDQNIGRVLAKLKGRGVLNNTLVVFTSDNGACAEWDAFGFDIKSGPENALHRGVQLEQMGPAGTFHSVGSGWANASNTPWRLYKHFNHEGGIAVPGTSSPKVRHPC